MKTIPEDLHEDINKRNLIKNIKSLYRTKVLQNTRNIF